MPRPIELQLFPSCQNCLSWSADGELAIAAGEYVHIITPKNAPKQNENGAGSKPAAENWHITRFRANVFSDSEWPRIYPQDRDFMSLGAEQSLSTVVGLSWSPPGLAKHRRCILAVLTSGLLLSIYDLVGGKWSRVAIVNTALETYFHPFIQETKNRIRKKNIRTFDWCPSLKVPAHEGTGGPNSLRDYESRWGIQLLTITNDENDVVVLQARRVEGESCSDNLYTFDVLSVTSVCGLEEHGPTVEPGSLLSVALKSRVRTLYTACGPWSYEPGGGGEKGLCRATGTVSTVYGTKLKLIKVDVTLARQDQDSTIRSKYTPFATCQQHDTVSLEQMNNYQLTGPIKWAYADNHERVYLAVGIFAGLTVISIPASKYAGRDEDTTEVEIREYPFYNSSTDEMENDPQKHWEPISAMAAFLPKGVQNLEPQIHLGTNGGYTAAMKSLHPQNQSPMYSPPWIEQFDDYRDRFDINRDLGGLVVGKIWGLAFCRGMVAAAFTMHPGDEIEYSTASEERTYIVFSSVNSHQDEDLQQTVPSDSPEFFRAKREKVLEFILSTTRLMSNKNTWSPNVIYAAACCAILDSRNETLLSQAQESLERLASVTGVDLSDEISKCTTVPNALNPKSTKQLSGLGADVFERCDICGAGMAWNSTQEAQCASGHLFARCNLTALAIQEPGISKWCSNCGMEYLSEDLIESSFGPDFLNTYRVLTEAFDTCIYCDGKFTT